MKKLGALLSLVALSLIGCVGPTSFDDEGVQATQAFAEQAENPDVQSPEEIAQAREAVERDFPRLTDPDEVSAAGASSVLTRYPHLDPERVVPKDLLQVAVTYFEQNKNGFPNKDYITVVDFSRRSDRYRFFLVDMTTGAVETYHTSHGRGGDVDDDGVAESFGNVPNSQKSSLGFARTAEVYSGTYGRAIRLDGLSTTNSKIRERFIVFHGWKQTYEANVIQGRSAGCITLDYAVKDPVLEKIKEGSLMYVGVSKQR